MFANVQVKQQHMQYARAMFGKAVFTSSSYTKSQNIDYCVQYKCGGQIRYGLINRYIKGNFGEAQALVQQLEISEEPVISGNMVRSVCQGTVRVTPLGVYRLLPLDKVVEKCIYICLPHIVLVTCSPNHCERD